MTSATAAGRGMRFPALDRLRAAAAFMIIGTHAGFASGRSLRTDFFAAALGRFDFGVAIFFVLSGFLLYRPTALHTLAGGPAPRPLSFWWRRALRIFPALWVSVAVTLALLTQRASDPSDWWHYLLLVQVYDHHETDPNLSQLWTLSVEIAFYAVLPVLGVLAADWAHDTRSAVRAHLIVIAALAALALAFNIVQSNLLTHTQALLWAPGYVDWFAAGMALAVLSAVPQDAVVLSGLRRGMQECADAPTTCWLVALVLWLFTTTQLGTPRTVVLPTFWQWTVQHYLYLCAAFLLMLPLVLGRWRGRPHTVGARIGGLFGNLSYSVYLWHLPLLLAIQRAVGWRQFGGHFWALTALTTVASLAVAAVSWVVIERPVLRYGSLPWRGVESGRPARTAKQTAASVKS